MAERLPQDLRAEIRRLEEENRRFRAGIRALRKQNQDGQPRDKTFPAGNDELQAQIDKRMARKDELESRAGELEAIKGELEKLVERLQRRFALSETHAGHRSPSLP
jgi:predicted  nucleic acid-binding Zn-ribbon protein